MGHPFNPPLRRLVYIYIYIYIYLSSSSSSPSPSVQQMITIGLFIILEYIHVTGLMEQEDALALHRRRLDALRYSRRSLLLIVSWISIEIASVSIAIFSGLHLHGYERTAHITNAVVTVSLITIISTAILCVYMFHYVKSEMRETNLHSELAARYGEDIVASHMSTMEERVEHGEQEVDIKKVYVDIHM